MLQCSYHRCDRIALYNIRSVENFFETYATLGDGVFTCYYDPYDHSYAILEVVTVATAIHCIFWPTIALVCGLTIVFVFIFCTDGENLHEGRQLQFPSIERRLAHITERTVAQSGESSHSEKLVPSQYYISDTNDVNQILYSPTLSLAYINISVWTEKICVGLGWSVFVTDNLEFVFQTMLEKLRFEKGLGMFKF